MTKPSKTEAKIEIAQAAANESLATIRAKAERRIAKIQKALAAAEAKINGRLEKFLRKADAKLKRAGAERFVKKSKRARKGTR